MQKKCFFLEKGSTILTTLQLVVRYWLLDSRVTCDNVRQQLCRCTIDRIISFDCDVVIILVMHDNITASSHNVSNFSCFNTLVNFLTKSCVDS